MFVQNIIMLGAVVCELPCWWRNRKKLSNNAENSTVSLPWTV